MLNKLFKEQKYALFCNFIFFQVSRLLAYYLSKIRYWWQTKHFVLR